MVLLGAVAVVPIEHPWHQVLVAVVEGLSRQGGPLVAGLEDVS